MYIKMLNSTRGSVDGINSQAFEAGNVYEVNDDLGNVFVNVMKVAVSAGDAETLELAEKALDEHLESIEKEVEQEKALKSAPENKAEDGAPENKSSKKAK